jgi:hypothetical protein
VLTRSSSNIRPPSAFEISTGAGVREINATIAGKFRMRGYNIELFSDLTPSPGGRGG